MTQRYKASGKEVLRNFRHFADCIDAGAAQMIVDALNSADCAEATEQRDLPLADNGPLFKHVMPERLYYNVHSVRQENDEYACSCGKRWDVADGEDHP